MTILETLLTENKTGVKKTITIKDQRSNVSRRGDDKEVVVYDKNGLSVGKDMYQGKSWVIYSTVNNYPLHKSLTFKKKTDAIRVRDRLLDELDFDWTKEGKQFTKDEMTEFSKILREET